MHREPDWRGRRTLRLKGYDYASSGAYFITICTHERLCLLDSTDVKGMLARTWIELMHRFPDINVDEFIIMPNHIHGIILINTDGLQIHQNEPVGADLRVCPENDTGIMGQQTGPPIQQGEHIGSPLHRVVQWYKTMTTNYYIRGVKNSGWAQFSGKLWQRNYYEHIVRDDEELNTVRQYIRENPLKWESDSENPLNLKTKG